MIFFLCYCAELWQKCLIGRKILDILKENERHRAKWETGVPVQVANSSVGKCGCSRYNIFQNGQGLCAASTI